MPSDNDTITAVRDPDFFGLMRCQIDYFESVSETIQEFKMRLRTRLSSSGLLVDTSCSQILSQVERALSWAEKTDPKTLQVHSWDAHFRHSKLNREARVEICALGIEISAKMLRRVAEVNRNDATLSAAEIARIRAIRAVARMLPALISDINSEDPRGAGQ